MCFTQKSHTKEKTNYFDKGANILGVHHPSDSDDVEEEDSDEPETQNNKKPFDGLNEQAASKPMLRKITLILIHLLIDLYSIRILHLIQTRCSYRKHFAQAPNFPHHYSHLPELHQSAGPLGPPQIFFQRRFKPQSSAMVVKNDFC